eukprot:gene14973-biopygen17145
MVTTNPGNSCSTGILACRAHIVVRAPWDSYANNTVAAPLELLSVGALPGGPWGGNLPPESAGRTGMEWIDTEPGWTQANVVCAGPSGQLVGATGQQARPAGPRRQNKATKRNNGKGGGKENSQPGQGQNV